MPSRDLPAKLPSIGEARAFVAHLAEGNVEDPDAVVLMTSELVTNVVVHAPGDMTVRVVVGPPFRVEVRDGVAPTGELRALIAQRPPPVSPKSIGGRGIGLVHALAKRIGLDGDSDGGKVVWFEV